jgi:nucleotide-binding universal stress UspA family protein
VTSHDLSTIGQNIVVGVDGSPEARDAALLGRRLTEAAAGSLHLVTAASQVLFEVAATRAGLETGPIRDALLAAAEAKAAESLQSDFTAEELSPMLTARLGRPEHVLAEAGREVGADSFVLGGHDRGRATSWLRRGTAHHLLRVCDQPVVVTGPDGPRVERVLAAVDRSFAAAPTIAVARRLAELLDASLQGVHVVTEPSVPPGFALDFDLGDSLRVEQEKTEAHLRALLPEDSSLTVVRGEVAPSLRSVLEGGPPTLLVLGAQGRGWVHRLILGSTTETLLAELPSSLVIVPSSPTAS